MKTSNLTKAWGRQALGAIAAVAMAVTGGTASASIMLSDVTVDTGTIVYDGATEGASFTTSAFSAAGITSVSNSYFDFFGTNKSADFLLNVNETTGAVDSGTGDLLIDDSGTSELEGQAQDWMIDAVADTLSVLYSVTGGSLTTASYVVAVHTYSTDLTDTTVSGLTALDGASPGIVVYAATSNAPIPEAGSIALLLSGFGLLGLVRARRQRG